MKNSPIKNITEILQNSHLTQIVQRNNELNLLNEKVKRLLPTQFRPLCRITNLSNNILYFDVQNATIKQGLLLQQTNLLTLIQTDFPQVNQLEFQIKPNFYRP